MKVSRYLGSARPDGFQQVLRIVLTLAAVTSFALGLIGFARMLPRAGIEAGTSWTDLVYYTLQLFLLDAAPLQSASGLPIVLEIARFLAPLSTALALILAAKTVLDSTYLAARARALRGHVVVCGNGLAATLIARDAAAEGRGCVVIDNGSTDQPPPPDRGAAADRARPVIRVGGDPRDADILRAVHVRDAREIVVVTGDSALNADVAIALQPFLDATPSPPRCFLEMSSPELAIALAAHRMNHEGRARVEFFDPDNQAARRLLDEYLPPPGDADVLLVGNGDLYHAVAREIERRGARTESGVPVRLLTVQDIPSLTASENLAVVLVSVPEDMRAVQAGLAVVARLRGCSVDVVVATRSSTALGPELSGADLAGATAGRARLHVFNCGDHVYSLPSLREGVYLDIARAAHAGYVRNARARGERVTDNPSSAPWAQLPDDLKRANLDQALSVGAKLREIGCVVVPAGDTGATDQPFAFEGTEIERLARLEHDRWCAERTQAGWRPGSPRDDVRKIHPDLVDWAGLSEASRQKDRDAVIELPALLREAGLHIVRPAHPAPV